ncbi:Flp family type IVb pilin [Bdellovibrio bacteriovorus]
MKAKTLLKNKKGQGLVEYLIIVAIVAVGAIGVIKVVGGNINVQFANVAQALGGSGTKKATHEVTETLYKKKDFSDFFEGSVNPEKSKSK